MAKTIIVGSGPSGMVAAHTLFKEGEKDFLVLEKLGRIGGRIESYTENGYHIDVAAQLVHPGYKMAKEIIEELGLSDHLIQGSMSKLRMYDEVQKAFVNTKPTEGNPGETALTMQWMGPMGENFMRFVQWVQSRCADGKMYEGEVTWGLDVDGELLSQYVEERFGKEVLERFCQPIISAVALSYPEKLSTLYGLQILWTVLVGNVALMDIGLESIVDEFLKEFGDKCKTNSEVTEIVAEDGKIKGVRTAGGEFYECENVICAVEAPVALRIIPALPDLMKKAIGTVTYSKVMTVLTFTDRLNLDYEYFGTGSIFGRRCGLPFGVVSFKSTRVPQSVPEGKECISLFVFDKTADELWDKSDAEVEEVVLTGLRKVFDFFPNEIDGYYIARYEYGNNLMPPGSATAMNELRLNHYQDIKGLYLAGDYLFTSSYESAMYTGRRVAFALLGNQTQLV